MKNNPNISNLKNANCDIQALDSPELCFPKSQLIKSLSEYKKLIRNNICTSTDPCIMSKNGLVLPDAYTEIPTTPINWLLISNDSIDVSCEEWNTISANSWKGNAQAGYYPSSDFPDTNHSTNVPAGEFQAYIITTSGATSYEECTPQEKALYDSTKQQLNETAKFYGLTLLNCNLSSIELSQSCPEAIASDIIELDTTTAATIAKDEIVSYINDNLLYNEDGELIGVNSNTMKETLTSNIVFALASRLSCTYINKNIITSCPDVPPEYSSDIIPIGSKNIDEYTTNEDYFGYILTQGQLNRTYLTSDILVSLYPESVLYNFLNLHSALDYIQEQTNTYNPDDIENLSGDIYTNISENLICGYQNQAVDVTCNSYPDLGSLHEPYKNIDNVYDGGILDNVLSADGIDNYIQVVLQPNINPGNNVNCEWGFYTLDVKSGDVLNIKYNSNILSDNISINYLVLKFYNDNKTVIAESGNLYSDQLTEYKFASDTDEASYVSVVANLNITTSTTSNDIFKINDLTVDFIRDINSSFIFAQFQPPDPVSESSSSIINTIFSGSFTSLLSVPNNELVMPIEITSKNEVSLNNDVYKVSFDENIIQPLNDEIITNKERICYITNNKITVFCDKSLIAPYEAEHGTFDAVFNYDYYVNNLNENKKFYLKGIALYLHDYKIFHNKSMTNMLYDSYFDEIFDKDTNSLSYQFLYSIKSKANCDINTNICLGKFEDLNSSEPTYYYLNCNNEIVNQPDYEIEEINVYEMLNNTLATPVAVANNNSVKIEYTSDDYLNNAYYNDNLNNAQSKANQEAAETAALSLVCMYGNRYIPQELCNELELYTLACANHGGIADSNVSPAIEIGANTYYGDSPFVADDSAYTVHLAYSACYCKDYIGGGGGTSISISGGGGFLSCSNCSSCLTLI